MNERYAAKVKKVKSAPAPPPLIYVRKRDKRKYLNPKLGWEAVKAKGMAYHDDGKVKVDVIKSNYIEAYVYGWSGPHITTLWFDAEHRDSNRSINWSCNCLWGQHAHQLRRLHLRSRYCSHAYAVAVTFGDIHNKRQNVNSDDCWRVLSVVQGGYRNGVTISSICDELTLQPNGVMQCLDILIKHEYVEISERSKADDIYIITDAGKAALRAGEHQDATEEEQSAITLYKRNIQRRDMVQHAIQSYARKLDPAQIARIQYQLQNIGFYKNEYETDDEVKKVLLDVITEELTSYDSRRVPDKQDVSVPVKTEDTQFDDEEWYKVPDL